MTDTKTMPTIREVNKVLADPANADLVARAQEIEAAIGNDTWTGGIAAAVCAAVCAAVEQRPGDWRDQARRWILDVITEDLGLNADGLDGEKLMTIGKWIAQRFAESKDGNNDIGRLQADNRCLTDKLRAVMQAVGTTRAGDISLSAYDLAAEVAMVRERDQLALAALLRDQCDSPRHPLLGWSIRNARCAVNEWPPGLSDRLVAEAIALRRKEEEQK